MQPNDPVTMRQILVGVAQHELKGSALTPIQQAQASYIFNNMSVEERGALLKRFGGSIVEMFDHLVKTETPEAVTNALQVLLEAHADIDDQGWQLDFRNGVELKLKGQSVALFHKNSMMIMFLESERAPQVLLNAVHRNA